MRGIFTGLSITLRHLVGRKVTRLYPYEKRTLPPRMRGLIHYLRDENGAYKCEGCLLCEKICPPQAITVVYRPRESHRDRPLTTSRAIWSNFLRSRRSLLSHSGRTESAVDQIAPRDGEPELDWARISALAGDPGEPGVGLVAALQEIQCAAGYLPRHAVARLSEVAGKDLADVYALATGATGFRTSPPQPSEAISVCQCPVCRNSGAADLVASVAAEIAAAGLSFVPSGPHARCLGDPRLAPVMRVDGKTYGAANPETARQIVRESLSVGGLPR